MDYPSSDRPKKALPSLGIARSRLISMLFLLVLSGLGTVAGWDYDKCIGGVGVVVCLVILIFGVLELNRFLVVQELDRIGYVTQGTISRLWMEAVRLDSEGDPIEYSYHMAYDYEDGFSAKMKLNVSAYKQLKVGDRLVVRFLSRDPSISRPEWGTEPESD